MEIIEELNDIPIDETRKLEEEYRINLGANLNSQRCFLSKEQFNIQHNIINKRYYHNNKQKIKDKYDNEDEEEWSPSDERLEEIAGTDDWKIVLRD